MGCEAASSGKTLAFTFPWPFSFLEKTKPPIMRFSLCLFMLPLVLLGGCARVGVSSRGPVVLLAGVNHSEKRLRASDRVREHSPALEPAGVPMTILRIADGDLEGFVRVRKARHPEDEETLPGAPNASAYLIVRKRPKHFRWGDAESCLAQFSNEAYGYAPNNDHLTYQVAGMTSDGEFSVFCSFSVGHPRLPAAVSARTYRARQFDAMERHPDIRLIEEAQDDAFRPSIDRVDAVIDSLKIHE